jgi:hypothetical protein
VKSVAERNDRSGRRDWRPYDAHNERWLAQDNGFHVPSTTRLEIKIKRVLGLC